MNPQAEASIRMLGTILHSSMSVVYGNRLLNVQAQYKSGKYKDVHLQLETHIQQKILL